MTADPTLAKTIYKHFIADMDGPAACGHASGSMQCTLSRWLTTCPDCLEVLQNETDANSKPCHGDHGTCAVCGNEIRYYGIAGLEGYGARWMHEQPTADGHDAELGGPA